jgi:molecular chaperone HscB
MMGCGERVCCFVVCGGNINKALLVMTMMEVRKLFLYYLDLNTTALNFSNMVKVSVETLSLLRRAAYGRNTSFQSIRWSSTSTQQSGPVTTNHYTLFPTAIPRGPPPNGSFAIDLSALKREFLSLQSKYHPDRHPEATRTRAAATSALVNDAYRTLADPFRRAQYILDMRGFGSGADDEGTIGVGTLAEAEGDEEMLMDVMEAREAAEEATSDEEVEKLRAENRVKMEKVIGTLSKAFEDDDLEKAKKEVVRLGYWVSVEDRLREGNSMH